MEAMVIVLHLLSVVLAQDESVYDEDFSPGTLDASAGDGACADSLDEETCVGFLEAGWCGTGADMGPLTRVLFTTLGISTECCLFFRAQHGHIYDVRKELKRENGILEC